MKSIRRTAFSLVLGAFLILASWQWWGGARIGGKAPSFSPAQAIEGEAAYQRHCSNCHGADLEGAGIAPPLTGHRFDFTWRGKTADALAFHVRRMPPASGAEMGIAALSEDTYTNILAHILAVNGFEPGREELPADTASLSELTLTRLANVELDPSQPVTKSPTQAALLERLAPVTEEMLRNPPPNDWLHWGRTYSAHSYSPLKTINKGNVAHLLPAWRKPLLHGSTMPMPLVHQGIMFLQTFPDTVIAMDATNGDVLWRYQRKGIENSNRKMGLSLHDDRLYVATSDNYVIALSAKTGELVWDHKMALGSESQRARYQTRSAPLVAGNVVIQTTLAFRDVPGGSFIIGVDRKTGREVWRFNTIARPDQPGGNTWNGLALEKRNGGSVWHQGTYDPELNLVYFGIAPTYDTAPLLVASDEDGVTNEAMYTNCTVALNADTGELAWYFQHTQNDQWDMDWAFERTIVELPDGEGNTVKAVMNVGKNAMLDALDAATGRFLFSVDTGVQNIIIGVDSITGAKTIDPAKMPNPENRIHICPSSVGARSWPQTSYSPDTKFVYVPIAESCLGMSETNKGGWLFTTEVEFQAAPEPDLDDGLMGRIQAIDVSNRKLAWNTDQRTPPSTGLLSTAGGVVFSGDLDPSLKAFDDATGTLLWESALDDTPSSSLITYQVGRTQYVAVVVGMTNNHVRDITAHYRRWSSTKGVPGDQAGASIWAFALP
ncbi:MAG: hypothetical protein CL917_18905 [Deltaproteobacteria bacterium]|nr:hypothetical protein [Deltaproteobacteria bacterium]